MLKSLACHIYIVIKELNCCCVRTVREPGTPPPDVAPHPTDDDAIKEKRSRVSESKTH